jgi:predicted ATP-dependent serine protease
MKDDDTKEKWICHNCGKVQERKFFECPACGAFGHWHKVPPPPQTEGTEDAGGDALPDDG